jgi:hypothetical protein
MIMCACVRVPQDIAAVATKLKIDGLIVSNTTISRPGLPARVPMTVRVYVRVASAWRCVLQSP